MVKKMNWTTEKQGKAVVPNDDNEEKSFFEIHKERIIAHVQARMERDKTYLACSITGQPKVGKTGIAIDCRTQEEIDEGYKILVLDYDDGAEPTWDSCWDRDPNIVIYCPTEYRRDGAIDWDASFRNGRAFCRLAEEMIEDPNEKVKAFVLDGVDKIAEGSSDVLRDHLVKQQTREGAIILPTDSVKVNPLDWKIRNRVYNRLMDLVLKLEVNRFLITHMKPVYGDGIMNPTPIGWEPDWLKQTPARFNQMIHIDKEQKEGATNYVAQLVASKTNSDLVGKKWLFFTTNGDNTWESITEIQQGTI